MLLIGTSVSAITLRDWRDEVTLKPWSQVIRGFDWRREHDKRNHGHSREQVPVHAPHPLQARGLKEILREFCCLHQRLFELAPRRAAFTGDPSIAGGRFRAGGPHDTLPEMDRGMNE